MITIEINERTKAGKIILEVARIFSKEDKEVTIIDLKPLILRGARQVEKPLSSVNSPAI